jgi:hypothetical protein
MPLPDFALKTMVILLLSVKSLLYGQEIPSLTTTHIELPDVYSNRTTNDILLDQKGTIWIANNNGLFYYDGIRCQQFLNKNIPPDQTGIIYQLAEDSHQNLWLLSQNGLFILNAYRDQFIAPENMEIPELFFQDANLALCRGADQDIFILCQNTIYRYYNNHFSTWATLPDVLPKYNTRINLFYSKKHDHIYISFGGALFICNKEGSVFTSWKAKYPDNFVADINPGTLPIRITSALGDSVSVFFHLDPRWVSQFHFLPHQNTYLISYPDKVINGFSIDEIYRYFLFKYKKNLDFQHIGGVQIIRLNKDILALASYEGILLLTFNPPKFKYYKQTFDKRVRAIQEDAYGHLIFGTYDGTRYFQKNNGSLRKTGPDVLHAWSILPTNKTRNQFIMQGEDIHNRLYFLDCTPTNVSVKKPPVAIGNDKYQSFNTCMALDEEAGGVWHITNDNKLSFYDLNNNTNTTFSPLLSERGEKVMLKHGGIWLGGNEGLQRFTTPDFSTLTYTNISHTIPQTIRKLSINTLYLDKYQNLWIGTNSKGLFKYHIPTGQYEQFTTEDGLAENAVFSMLSTQNDTVFWLGTGNGLSRFDFSHRWFDNYYTEDGLSGNEFNTAATYRATDGTIYMGGQNGINYFHPDSFSTNHQSLRQYLIISLNEFAPTLERKNMFLPVGGSLEIFPSMQVIEISFRSNDYFKTQQLHFKYRIPGIIDTWQQLNYSDKAIFPYFPPGKYVIEVQMKNHRGMWALPERYYLIVHPHWYQTWWFWLALALFIVLFLYRLYTFRLKQLRQEFNLRQQITHDLHDSLGSRIYLLRSLSHQITNPLSSEQYKKEQLRHFETLSQDTFKSIRDFIWAFDPTQDSIHQLFDRMDDFAENYLSPLVSTVDISRYAPDGDSSVGPRLKHHLMNIYQEVLTNIIKHTHVNAVNIQLRSDHKTITIQIFNQHRGYKNTSDPAQSGHKMGQYNLQHRLEEIGGDMTLSEVNKEVQLIKISVHY